MKTDAGAGLWDWAVAAYGRDGVAALCVELQDLEGQNVPLLLWAAWAAEGCLRIDSGTAADGAALARAWSEGVIVPLRTLRRRLKLTVTAGDETARLGLREQVKSAELASERILLAQLEPLVASGGGEAATVMGNLLVVAAAWTPHVPQDGLRRLSQALTKG